MEWLAPVLILGAFAIFVLLISMMKPVTSTKMNPPSKATLNNLLVLKEHVSTECFKSKSLVVRRVYLRAKRNPTKEDIHAWEEGSSTCQFRFKNKPLQYLICVNNKEVEAVCFYIRGPDKLVMGWYWPDSHTTSLRDHPTTWDFDMETFIP